MMEKKEERNHARDHPDGSSSPTIFSQVIMFVEINFPPVLFADSNVTSGPEKQGDIGESRYTQCNPCPDIFTNVAFCIITVVIADPAPKLS